MSFKVFLVCTGLGHVNRGLETFSRECFDHLSDSEYFDLRLFKGGGSSKSKEHVVLNASRKSWLARFFGRLFKWHPYYIEQLTFFFGLIPFIIWYRPRVIYFSDHGLGRMLARFKIVFKFKYKLLLSNGYPLQPPQYLWDHIQQLNTYYYNLFRITGMPEQQMSLIPYGFNFEQEALPITDEEKRLLRIKLDLPIETPIVIAVAALEKKHKRTDYLIREVAAIDEQRPFLLLLGEASDDTEELLALATQVLGRKGFAWITCSPEEVNYYYKASDYFVLTSLYEGFGRALVEAAYHGLPCLVHEHETTRFILDKYGIYTDMSKPGALSQILAQYLTIGSFDKALNAQRANVFKRFDWKVLREQYEDMLIKVADI